ncbi:MAG: right-handed parallel beta-helix repeat-containing protein [Dehalococcoidia bacterium]
MEEIPKPPARRRPHLWRIVVVVVVIGIAAGLLYARPWEAPDYDCVVTVRSGESLQAAIDAAGDGDVICLARGVWTETILIDKSLTIVGRGATRTSIEAEWRLSPVVEISSPDGTPINVKIEGLAVSWDGGHTGVEVGGSAVMEMINCRISGMMYGITVADSAHLVLRDSVVSNSRQRSITLSGSSRATISNSRISANMAPGLWLSGSAQATVSGSTISGNLGHGLWLRDQASAALTGCIVSDNRGHALLLTGDSTAQVLQSGFSGSWDQGIEIQDRATVELVDSAVHSNWRGVELSGESRATIIRSTISGNRWDGIRASGSGNVLLSDSVISGNSRGVAFSGSAGGDISDCLVEGNSTYGVFSWASGVVSGEGNRFRDNGIDLGGNVPGILRLPLRQPAEITITWPDERYASLQEAVDALLPGGQLTLGPGTHTAGLVIGAPLLVEAGHGDTVLMAKSGLLPVFSLVGGAELHISGLTITGGAEGMLVSSDAVAVVVDCTISGNTEGVNLSRFASAELVRCEIDENERRGVFVGGAAQAEIADCSIRDNGSQGIAVADSARITVVDSIVAGSDGEGGILLWGSPEAILEGNTISDNRGFGVATYQRPCFVISPWVFRGRISGGGNVIEANRRGEVCPPELEFLTTVEGGQLDLRP